MNEETRNRIQQQIERNRIVLFMKGNRLLPMCGFSAAVVQILDQLGADYQTVDVLEDPQIREGIKEFSHWPTIPQLYVGGQFIGGCDIVREMSSRGELDSLIKSGATPTT